MLLLKFICTPTSAVCALLRQAPESYVTKYDYVVWTGHIQIQTWIGGALLLTLLLWERLPEGIPGHLDNTRGPTNNNEKRNTKSCIVHSLEGDEYGGQVQTKLITLQAWLKFNHTYLEWYEVQMNCESQNSQSMLTLSVFQCFWGHSRRVQT